jgi:hypothetical protein
MLSKVVQKIPHHKLGRYLSLMSQNGGFFNEVILRLPYKLAHQRSHIGLMATIALIDIGVINLLGKPNKFMHEMF